MEGRQQRQSLELRSKQIKENLLLLFCSILHEYGPLSVNSSEFQQVWTSITPDQQNIIQFSGGLSNFLLQSNNVSVIKPDILFLKKDISEDSSQITEQHSQTDSDTSHHIQTAKHESLSLQNIVFNVFGDVLTPDKNQKNTQNCPRQTPVSVTESATQDICIDALIPEECSSNHRNNSRKKARKRAKNKEASPTKLHGNDQSQTCKEKPLSNERALIECQPGSSRCDPSIPSTYSMVAAKNIRSRKPPDTVALNTSKKTVKVPPDLRASGSKSEIPLCSICHDTLHNDKINKLQCGHSYHDLCIRKWLEIQKTCPTCRVLVLLTDEFPPLSFTT
ncbi:E3 ubiquitin-protein ligase DZIP3 [Octopus sinensis]|uniref:E3 ubiquitin-protein ligase DZIP3 n=1 Tax=Octopus sinensis TaxID=2607531 RepID=A0A6P7U7F5_9MOLL|nr:E3 ubiquitin-protein ligase DZIP3 [Octopus sinensis]